MTKTPEQLAEEWSRTPRQNQDVEEYQLSWDFVCEWEKESFLAGYQAAQQWISVKDRLPEHGVPVLVFDTLANTIELMSWDKIMEVFETDDAYFVQLNDASHWMPLPSVEGLKHED